jgi:nitrate/nitrite transport system permease protein
MTYSSIAVENARGWRDRSAWLVRAAGALLDVRAVDVWRTVGVPLAAILVFLAVWSQAAAAIDTTLGRIPGPLAVWRQAGALWADHAAERARAAAFYERQAQRNQALVAADPAARVVVAAYTGKPTFIDQILAWRPSLSASCAA